MEELSIFIHLLIILNFCSNLLCFNFLSFKDFFLTLVNFLSFYYKWRSPYPLYDHIELPPLTNLAECNAHSKGEITLSVLIKLVSLNNLLYCFYNYHFYFFIYFFDIFCFYLISEFSVEYWWCFLNVKLIFWSGES